MKRILNNLPELYFIGLGTFWVTENYLSSGRINYIVLLVTWLVFLQVFYKNRVLGMIYGSAWGLISAYKIYVAITGVYDLQSTVLEAVQSGTVFGIGLFMAIGMFYKYATAKEKYDESVLTVTF